MNGTETAKLTYQVIALIAARPHVTRLVGARTGSSDYVVKCTHPERLNQASGCLEAAIVATRDFTPVRALFPSQGRHKPNLMPNMVEHFRRLQY
jgi:hypothetical protein